MSDFFGLRPRNGEKPQQLAICTLVCASRLMADSRVLSANYWSQTSRSSLARTINNSAITQTREPRMRTAVGALVK
jgi:hypothetical protein